jgi:hypothetical protein
LIVHRGLPEQSGVPTDLPDELCFVGKLARLQFRVDEVTVDGYFETTSPRRL